MKKVIKPAEKEDVAYYSDFSGKCFGEWNSPVEIKIEFNNGSVYDDCMIGLHLTDEELKPILDIIKKNISKEYKEFLKHKLKKYNIQYDDSVSFGYLSNRYQITNSINLIKELLDIKNNE